MASLHFRFGINSAENNSSWLELVCTIAILIRQYCTKIAPFDFCYVNKGSSLVLVSGRFNFTFILNGRIYINGNQEGEI